MLQQHSWSIQRRLWRATWLRTRGMKNGAIYRVDAELTTGAAVYQVAAYNRKRSSKRRHLQHQQQLQHRYWLSLRNTAVEVHTANTRERNGTSPSPMTTTSTSAAVVSTDTTMITTSNTQQEKTQHSSHKNKNKQKNNNARLYVAYV